MGQLAEHGYTLAKDLKNADICVVNSCTVKNPSESRGLHLATWRFFLFCFFQQGWFLGTAMGLALKTWKLLLEV